MEYDIRRLQEVQLELLDELARVCGKYHIRFYLAAGSCIGAVRHQGFIPWDDDIDTFMYAILVKVSFCRMRTPIKVTDIRSRDCEKEEPPAWKRMN